MDSNRNIEDQKVDLKTFQAQQQQYKQKLEGLKKDLPFLLSVLEKLRNNNLDDPSRQTQLEKMQKLYDLINDESQVLKLETLNKCETVVKKLQRKMEQQTEVDKSRNFSNNAQATITPMPPKNTPNTAKPPLPAGEPIETDKTTVVINLDEIPVPESPPPQQQSDIEILPIEIPTERRNSPPISPKRDKNQIRGHRTHTHHQHHHHQHHRQSSHSHGSHQQQQPQNRQHDSASKATFHSSNPFKNVDNNRRDERFNNYNNNKNLAVGIGEERYSPEKAWDSMQNEPKQAAFTKSFSNNEAASGWQKQKETQFGSVFSRLGEKVPEATTETLQIQIRNDQHNRPPPKPSSLASKLQNLTVATATTPPTINPDLLKKPPLSANDISKLLIETNTNSNSNSNSFDYGFNKPPITTTAASASPSEPSTFDLIRKKFALLTKGNLSPSSDKNFSSKPSTLGSPTMATTSLPTKPASIAETLAANLGNVNVLPTLRPNDPRLRRAASLLNSTVAAALPQATPQQLPHTNLHSHHIPTIVSRQVVPLLPLPVQPPPQAIQVLQQSRVDNICITPAGAVRPLPPYAPTLTSIPCNAVVPPANPQPLMSMHISPPPPTTPSPQIMTSPTVATAHKAKAAAKQNENPFSTRYCDSDENWDSDSGSGFVEQRNSTTVNISPANQSSAISTIPSSSSNAVFAANTNNAASNFAATGIDSDENWDTDDNACDYGAMQSVTAAVKAQVVSEVRSQIQRRNSTTTPFVQRRNSISFKDVSRFNEQPESPQQSAVQTPPAAVSFENPFKRVLPAIKRIEPRFVARSPPETPTAYTRQSMERSLNSYDAVQQNTMHAPPPRRKSMSWENQATQQHRYSNPSTPPVRQDSYNNSPIAANTNKTDRFNAKINDSAERIKYIESKKKKAELPRTYGAYREAKARAAAEAEARKKAEEMSKTAETEPPILSTLAPAPIANSTLDNLYRSTNMTSCEIPKANITNFKIPKKQTSVVEDEKKKTAEKQLDDEIVKNSAKALNTTENQNEENVKKSKAEQAKKGAINLKETKSTLPGKSDKQNEEKEKNLAENLKKSKEQANKETKNIKETKKAAEKACKANSSKDTSMKKISTQAAVKKTNIQHIETKESDIIVIDEARPETPSNLEPKPQRTCFKNKAQQRLQNQNEKQNTKVRRDPRLVKNQKPTDESKTTKNINLQDAVEKVQLELAGKTAVEESLILNDSGWKIIDEVHGSDVEEDELTTSTKTRENAAAENVKGSPTPKEQFEDLINSPMKPRRILTRRCTMIDQASAPEVDKEKLAKVNAMLFEDLQEQERKKKNAAQNAKAHYSRRHIGEICYEKTDDNCTVSTQNIISGKRRTRTTVNFNEVQQGIAVFKHLKKAPTESVAKEVKSVDTSPQPVKTRQKPGPKPKPKSLENKVEKTPTPKQSTPPPTKTTAATTATAKPIRKRRQTFVEPPTQPKKQKETAGQENENETAALPHVTNIFDSFIQKILHPDTDAEDLINKLRDILNESEVQTLLDVRSAMAKKQQTTSMPPTNAIAENCKEKVTIEKPTISTNCAAAKSNLNTTQQEQSNATVKLTTTAQQTAKGKHYKTELDRLHDDIRDMFISEGVLTATGRRMCTFVKPTPAPASPSTHAAKTKADDSVALEMEKTKTTTNNETVHTATTVPARKTRSAVATAAAEATTKPTTRNLRKKQAAVYKDLSETEITDFSTTDLSTSTLDVSLTSDATTFTMSSSVVNLDTTITTQSDSSECLAALRDMPKLKPAKPVRLPEEDELEELMAKTKNNAIIKKKDIKAKSTSPITSSTPAVKSTTLKKRKKPCPKSKKLAADSTTDEEDDDFDDEENMTLIKIKQEMLDITVPFEEPTKFARQFEELKNAKNENEIKNINPKWHFQSRYAHVCAICSKRSPFISMHYKKFHRENYASRLAPSILHQLKVDNTSVSRPILKYAQAKNKTSTYLWLHRCPFCLQFKRTIFKSWFEHFISHTGEHCYECTLCHASSNNLNAIEKHMKERCIKQGGRYLHNDEITISSKPTTITAHICHLCNFLRLGRSGLEFHYVEQHGCDIKEAKDLGYTIVLMDLENVPFIETLEEANEVEEKLGSQFNGETYDLSEDEDESAAAATQSKEVERKVNKQNEEKHQKNKPKIAEETENAKKLPVKSKTEKEDTEEKPIKLISKTKIIKKKAAEEKKNVAAANEENTPKDSETLNKAAPTTANIRNVTLTVTPKAKATVSNAFMSTTDDSNDEEAITTSKRLVNKIYNVSNEAVDSTHVKAVKKSSNSPVTMAERLSQRLKEAEEKAISPTKQSQPQPQFNQIQNLKKHGTQNDTKTNENVVDVAETNDVEMLDEDEEDDGWEDIEIVESAPSANSSMTSHSSSLSGKESKTHKSKLNTLSKFSRFLAAPSAAKSRKKNNKGLKSLMTLFSDNIANESEHSEIINVNAQKTAAKTTATIAQTKSMQANIANEEETQEKAPTNQMPNATATVSQPKTTTDSTTTTTKATKAADSTKTANSTTTALGFRPLITSLSDLLPDSSSNDPIELVPELAPSGPLQDLNDLTSFLGENLTGIMDLDVDASSNSVCIHAIDNRETSIQDALDFVTSQSESFIMAPNANVNSNDPLAPTTPITMNRVQNVGFNCTTLNGVTSYKFYCLSDRCTFLFSSEAIGLQNHLLFEHPETKWNGYCETCAAQIRFVTTDTEFSYTQELEHLLEVHTKTKTQRDEPKINAAEEETSREEQTPRIKLRRLSGDCLSTATGNSNSSSSNAALLNALEDSNSFSDLIRFNPPRRITLSSDESQSTSAATTTAAKTATNQMNTTNEVPIEIACMSNDGVEQLFKNIGNDFQITSISSGLEPNEFSEVIKNAYQRIETASPSTNAKQSSAPLQIASVVSLNETTIVKESNASATPTQTPKPKMNVMPAKSKQSQSLLKKLLQSKDAEIANAPTPTTATATTTVEVDASTAKSVETSNATSNAESTLPKITNVCSLSSNATQHRAGSLWSKQIERERNELVLSAAETADIINMRLANANAWRKASRIGRSATPPASTPPTCGRSDSPEPLVVSETMPVAQATTGQFVITQTVSAQYNETNEAGSNSITKPTLGFNISISAADLNLATSTSTVAATTSIDLTDDNDEQEPHPQQQQQTFTKLPPLKCLESPCQFIARHFVAMIDHIKMHDLQNDSTKREYLRCSICAYKCRSVDDYTNHIREKHFPNAATQKSSVSSTTSNVMSPSLATISMPKTSSNILDKTASTSTDKAATALTEKIRNILSGKQTESAVGSATVSSSSNIQSLKKNEDSVFKEQLYEIIKSMVAKTGLAENKLFRCLVSNCNIKLDEENYHTHVLYHLTTVGHLGVGPFNCPHCKTKCADMPKLKKHIKNHARHNFFCYICLETAPNSDMISKHFSEQHNFKKDLLRFELLTAPNSTTYFVVHSAKLTISNIHDYGKKLIIEWQRKKAEHRTHFFPNEVDLLPMQPIFSRDLFCGVCQLKTKVRINMLRHLKEHKADEEANNASGSNQTSMASRRTFMDPVNPVPCLVSNEKHFDRMTNLASSSLGTAVPQSSNTGANATATATAATTTPFEATCRLRYGYVPEIKRYICGVPGCQYLTITEDIFRQHLSTLHADVRNYSCPLCNDIICKKSFQRERVMVHLRFHDRTMFQCQHCDYNHYMRHVVEKHVLEKHGNVSRANIFVFVRDERQPLEGVSSIITVHGKKTKDSIVNENLASVDAINMPATQKDTTSVAPAAASHASLMRKQRMSIDMSTRPLWQRDDPTRVRQIRGIPMEDEADTERLRKRLRLNDDSDDDDDNDQSNAKSLSNETIAKLYLNTFEFGCFHCETKTLNLPDLRAHWQKAHSTASNCGTTKPFQFRLLKQLKCAECQKFFGCYWELRDHLKTAHNKTAFYAADAHTKKLFCAFCDYECVNTLQLQRHSQRQDHLVHDIKALTAIQMVQTMRLESDEDPKATRLTFVQCQLCNELFCSGHEVAKHAHTKHAAEIDRFSFREFKNTILYRCSECAYASAEELSTLRHMINHYSHFKRCNFCLQPQTTFNGYMQHCYSDHRSEIRRFSEIYTLVDIRKYLLQILVLFPNGWTVDKRNLRDTPYGSGERIRQFYAEICKTSQEPPIPRLSLGRLVARKSIEAQQQQQPQQSNGESGSASTAAAMQLAGNANPQSQKQTLTAMKISKRRSTVAIGHDMAGIKHQPSTSTAKRQKLATHIVESRNKVVAAAPIIPAPPKFTEAVAGAAAAVAELKPYSFYGKRPEVEDTSKIFTNISFAGVNTRIPLGKFKILVHLDAHVVLEKLNIRKLCAAKNAAKYQLTEECEVGSSSGSAPNIASVPINPYAHIKKACPASQKYRFT